MEKKTAALLYLALSLAGLGIIGTTLLYAIAYLPSLLSAGAGARGLVWVCAGGVLGIFCLVAPTVYLFSGTVVRRMEMADQEDGEEEDPPKGEA